MMVNEKIQTMRKRRLYSDMYYQRIDKYTSNIKTRGLPNCDVISITNTTD